MLNQMPLFWRRVFVVMSGTAMAQAIPFLTIPILTRLLPPSELGAYFIWVGIVTVLSVVLSLRLDVAIFNAQTNRQLRDIINAAVICSVSMAASFYAAMSVLDFLYPQILANLKIMLWRGEALILAVVFAINMVVQSAYVYGAYFKRQATVKVIQAAAVAVAQIGAVLIGLGIKGMIFFQIVAMSAMTIWNFFDISSKFKFESRQLSVSSVAETLRLHWRFPVYSMPADFIGSLASQIPMLMLGGRFGVASAGQYALTNKALAVPVKLLSSSILAVFKEEAARNYREKGECRDVFIKTFKSLAILGLLPFGGLYFFAEPVFTLFFGKEWSGAGVYASILAPMFYVQFVVSPLSYTLYLANRQASDFLWQIALLTMTVVVFYLANEALFAVKFYAAGCSLLYFGYLGIAYSCASSKKVS